MSGQNNTFRPMGDTAGSYEYKQFTLGAGASDYDVKATQSALFGGSTSPMKPVTTNPATQQQIVRRVARIIASAKIGIKFNATSNPEIIMESSESPFVECNIDISNIYLKDENGAGATVGILLYK